MDNTRILLWFAFLAMVWLAFNQWIVDYAPEEPPAQTTTGAGEPPDLTAQSDDLPSIGPGPAPGPDVAGLPAAEDDATAAELEDPIRVRTDVLDLLIDRNGGDIVRADLLQYPIDKDEPDRLVRLLDYTPAGRWVFETGMRHATEADGPTHLAHYTAPSSSYLMADGSDELLVALSWVDGDGARGRKVYRFHRGRYDVDLTIEIENAGPEPWPAVGYAQMTRRHDPPERSFMSVDTYSFTGPVLYDGEQYEKLDFEDIAAEPVDQTLAGGWLASIQHHFLAAAVPPADAEFRYLAATRGENYVLTAIEALVTEVAPGATDAFKLQLFVGPKLQDQLEATREGLALTVDYGLLTVLAQPLFWLLDKAHGVLGNWGWSIIAITFLIKLAFYKLTATSGRSMARMRKIAPRMKALQERYKDDRQALSQAMMELYKKEKVNPAAGCLPILIQMPFFFAFYWVLIESVEMRQAPFALWIDDLSVRDPFFILPILMGAAMFFQTKLNPAPPDPTQARIMQIMPILFTGFMAFFPAGLVIYWLTNTVLGIAQQWRINQVVAAES